MREWWVCKKIYIKSKETEVVVFGNESVCGEVLFFEQARMPLSVSESVSILGVIIDSGLKRHEHPNDLCIRLSRAIYGLRVLSELCELSTIKAQYFANFNLY